MFLFGDNVFFLFFMLYLENSLDFCDTRDINLLPELSLSKAEENDLDTTY